MLGILILSSILAISFSLATVLFVETKNSGDLARAEPSYYGASAVSEEALFNVKRKTNVTSYSSAIGNVQLTSSSSLLHDAVQQDKVVPASNSFSGSQNIYLIYNPAQPQGASGYGGIRVTFLNTGSQSTYPKLHIYVCEFDPADPTANCNSLTDPTGSYQNPSLVYYDQVLTAGQCWPSCSGTAHLNGDALGGKQEELILYSENSTANEYVNIETFGTDGSAKGLPYFGQTAVDIASNDSSVTRKVRVVIPNSDSAVTSLGNTATFVSQDTTTQGNWHGVYGSEGYNVIGGTVSYPAYVTVTPANNLAYTWADPTADTRALYKDAVTTNRLASTWYNSSPWTIDFNFTDGAAHQVAIYALDWDGSNSRAMTIDALDGSTSAVLDTRNVSSYSSGFYYVWNMSGHVVLRFTNTAGWNAVVEGIFFK